MNVVELPVLLFRGMVDNVQDGFCANLYRKIRVLGAQICLKVLKQPVSNAAAMYLFLKIDLPRD